MDSSANSGSTSRDRSSAEPVAAAVANSFARHCQAGQKLLLGLSGGLDSITLLHAAHIAASKQSLSLEALHVHHGLSPNADSWADHCKTVCAALGVPLQVRYIDVPRETGTGIEDAARRLRHQALAEAQADWLLLAHHAGDQAETLLLNLLRGAGLLGASAMPIQRGNVLRPLLPLPRDVLEAYAETHGLHWIEDESNRDPRYTRNFIRHQVMPILATRFPDAEARLASATRRFAEAQVLLEDLAHLDCGETPRVFPFPLTVFRQLSDARACNVLRTLLLKQNVQAPDEKRLREFVRQLQTAAPDRHPRLDLPGYALWVSAKHIHFQPTSA